MSKYAIEGLFLTQRVTGIQRFARELIGELDRIVPYGLIEVVVPEDYDTEGSGVNDLPSYKNIKIVKIGHGNGTKWQQTIFCKYIKRNNLKGIFLMNTLTVLYPKGIVAIHDVSYKANPTYFTGLRGKLSAKWHCLCYYAAAKAANKGKLQILTVSEYSKSQIVKYYKVKPERITVVYDAWQHVMDIKEDSNALNKYDIKSDEYFFALSSLMPNKNFKWIVNAAKNNPKETFVVAGGDFNKESGKELIARESEGKEIPNIKFVGYVSDEEAKSLMIHCKGFLFPSLYEGFGIPPLEAIANGAKRVYVSDIPVLREIYGDYVSYIDPLDYGYKFSDNDKLLLKDKADELLGRFSFEREAKKLLEMLV